MTPPNIYTHGYLYGDLTMASFTWEEIEQLSVLLEAEALGVAVDADEACRVAARLSQIYPEIAGTMGRIIDRFAPLKAAA
jgi:hypothetical protein